jgi:hypothetical protein
MNESKATGAEDTMAMWEAAGIDMGTKTPEPAPKVAASAGMTRSGNREGILTRSEKTEGAGDEPADLVAAPVRRPGLIARETTPEAAPAIPAIPVIVNDGRRFRAAGPANAYVEVLERKLANGSARAAQVVEGIFRDIPTDRIARIGAVRWVATKRGVVAEVGDDALLPTGYALGQIAERAGVPAPYLRELAAPRAEEGEEAKAWRADLAAHILSKHYAAANGRALVRSVNSSLRGWLSDRYRRLDSRPLVEALVKEAEGVGAIPWEGSSTETRVAIKVIIPEVIEPLPGEYMLVGAEWSNSDYGNGTNGIRSFAIRVACLNGMTRENLLKQVHLGGRLSEDVSMSDRTHRLDTAASVSALRDVVRGALGPGRVERITEQLRAAAERHVTAGALRARVEKTQPKAIAKSIVDAFESEDVINLPAGPNAWRASNAISWIARHTEDEERRLDLERLAGSLV